MANRKPKTQTLADFILANPKTGKSWLKNLTAEQRKQLAETKEKFYAGKFVNWTKKALRDQVQETFGIEVSITTFREYMNAK